MTSITFDHETKSTDLCINTLDGKLYTYKAYLIANFTFYASMFDRWCDGKEIDISLPIVFVREIMHWCFTRQLTGVDNMHAIFMFAHEKGAPALEETCKYVILKNFGAFDEEDLQQIMLNAELYGDDFITKVTTSIAANSEYYIKILINENTPFDLIPKYFASPTSWKYVVEAFKKYIEIHGESVFGQIVEALVVFPAHKNYMHRVCKDILRIIKNAPPSEARTALSIKLNRALVKHYGLS